MPMTISLTEEQEERLAKLCREEDVSRTEAVRRAIARYLDEYRQARRREHRDDVFGMWRGRELSGLASERRLRDEWS